jgi:hypothetical protein
LQLIRIDLFVVQTNTLLLSDLYRADMQFTVVFDMKYNLGDGSFSIRYHPAPYWLHGDKGIPNSKLSSGPSYTRGSLKPLLIHAELNDETLDSRKVIVIIQKAGYGGSECLNNLIQDLRAENFDPITIGMD